MAPFFFRGNLTVLDVGVNFNAMDNLATIEADFDVDESTIIVLVPVEVIDLLDGVEFDDCSEIRPGDGLRGGTVETSLAAWITMDSFPHDMIFGFNTFTAPHALDAEVDCAGEPVEPVEP